MGADSTLSCVHHGVVTSLTRSEHGERRWQGRQSALHRAATFGHAAVAAALVDAVRAKQAAARTVATAATATTPLATTAAAYVDHKDMAGWTPLHLAAQQGHSHALRTLLEAGANHAATNQVSAPSHPSSPRLIRLSHLEKPASISLCSADELSRSSD